MNFQSEGAQGLCKNYVTSLLSQQLHRIDEDPSTHIATPGASTPELEVGSVMEPKQPFPYRVPWSTKSTRVHITSTSRDNPKILLAFPTNSPWQRWKENVYLQAPRFYLPYITVHPKLCTSKGWYSHAIKKSFKSSKMYSFSVKTLLLGQRFHDGTCYTIGFSGMVWSWSSDMSGSHQAEMWNSPSLSNLKTFQTTSHSLLEQKAAMAKQFAEWKH